MAVRFRKVQRKVMSGVDKGQVKTYAVAKSAGYCDMEKLCKLISARSAMSSADVKAILDSLNWAMDLELQAGNIVQVGEFGNFRLSIRTNGADKETDFNAQNIRQAKLIFTPGSSLRKSTAGVSFKEADTTTITETVECTEPHA